MKLSIERVVAIFTPLFAAVSGAATGAISQLVPGVTLSPGDITALQIAGVTAGVGASLKWLHGRQQFVKAEGDTEALVQKLAAKIKADAPTALALSDIEGVLKAHTDEILTAVGNAVKAPAAVDAVAKQIADRLVGAQPAAAERQPSPAEQIAPAPAPAVDPVTPAA